MEKIEKEFRRIEKIIQCPNYHPLQIFGLSPNFNKYMLKKEYYRISLLLHPDKSFDNDRFTRLFTIITEKYKILMNNNESMHKEPAKSKKKIEYN